MRVSYRRRCRPRRLGGRCGSIAVETALTLPLMVLLCLSGFSLLWWGYNKMLVNVVVYEEAQRAAADPLVLGLVADVATSGWGPGEDYGVPGLRVVAFRLPLDPPVVFVAACGRPGGRVIDVREWVAAAGPAPRPAEPQGLLDEARALLRQIQALERRVEQGLEDVRHLVEQLIFVRRAVEQVTGGIAASRRQVAYLVLGEALEWAGSYRCRQAGGTAAVLTAKAVIEGERTWRLR